MQGSFVASGNIAPSRFVTQTSSATGKVTQSTTGDAPYGISHESTRNVPYSSLDDGYAAIAGENLRVYQDDEECYLESGAAITHGARLKPDTDGKGTPVTTDKDAFGAIALQACSASGTLIRVKVMKGGYVAI